MNFNVCINEKSQNIIQCYNSLKCLYICIQLLCVTEIVSDNYSLKYSAERILSKNNDR